MMAAPPPSPPPQNFTVAITYDGGGGLISHEIRRTLSFPPSTTFNDVHIACQIAFDSDNTDLFAFDVFGVRHSPIGSLGHILKDVKDQALVGDWVIQRAVGTGGRLRPPIDREAWDERSDQMRQDRNRTINRRLKAYSDFDPDDSDDMRPVNRSWPAPRPVPRERVATRAKLTHIWGDAKHHGRTIIYQAGPDKFCLKLVRRGPPPKQTLTAQSAHETARGNPVVCTSGAGHPHLQDCSLFIQKAAFHHFGAKTWDKPGVNRRLASMVLGRETAWRGVLWRLDPGEQTFYQRMKSWRASLGRERSPGEWWNGDDVAGWCERNVDRGEGDAEDGRSEGQESEEYDSQEERSLGEETESEKDEEGVSVDQGQGVEPEDEELYWDFE